MTLTSIIQANPKISILFLSFIVTLFITAVSYFVTDHVKMRGIKEKQKRLREEMKLHKDNPQKMMELQKQMMEDFPHQMKESLKTSVITLVPILIFFSWLRKTYALTTLSSSWIWWYIIASILFSIGLRKIFKMD